MHFIGSFYEIYIMMHDPRTSNSQSNLAKTPLAYGKNVIYILKLNIKNWIPSTKQAFLIFNPPFIRINPASFLLGDSG